MGTVSKPAKEADSPYLTLDNGTTTAGSARPGLSIFTLCMISACLLGVQFSWSAQFVVVTTYFKSLGLSDAQSQAVWALGPISGFVVQPIAGSLSDNCTSRFGRRRPFIGVGALMTIVAMVFFSNAVSLGKSMGDTEDSKQSAIWIAFWAMAVMNLSVNTLQGLLRAIVSDMATDSQQETGQSIATVMQAAGDIGANLQAYYMFKTSCDAATVGSDTAAFDYDALRIYFLTGYAILFVTASLTLVFAKEEQYVPPVGVPSLGLATRGKIWLVNAVREIGPPGPACVCRGFWAVLISPLTLMKKVVDSIPGPMRRLCVVQVFAWFAWFCFLPIATAYMGDVVYNGAANKDICHTRNLTDAECSVQMCEFQSGVSTGSLGLMGKAGVQFVFSAAVPFLTAAFGLHTVWAGSNVLLAAGLMAMYFIKDKVISTILLATTGIAFASTNIFPFAVIGRLYTADGTQGLLMGTLNIFIVLPQLVDTAYTGAVTQWQSEATVFLIGSVWAILAAISVCFVQTELPNETGELIVDAENGLGKPLLQHVGEEGKSSTPGEGV